MPEFVKKDHDYSAVESYLQNNDVNITNDLTVGGNLTGNIPLRDYIINGSFKYWMDNTGLSAGTGGRYTATLFSMFSIVNAYSVTRNTNAIGQLDVPTNSPYYATITTTDSSGASNASLGIMRMEDVRIYANKTQTLSIWASSSTGTPKIAIEASQFFGRVGSPSASVLGISITTLSLSTTITRYDIKIDWPSISGKTLGTADNTSFGQFNIWFSAGSDYNARTNSLGHQAVTVNIYKMQLIDGDEYQYIPERSDTEELSLIGRYYQKSYETDVVPSTVTYTGSSQGQAITSSYSTCRSMYFSTPMRIPPQISVYSCQNGTVGSITDINVGGYPDVAQTYFWENGATKSLNWVAANGSMTVGHWYAWQWVADARF